MSRSQKAEEIRNPAGPAVTRFIQRNNTGREYKPPRLREGAHPYVGLAVIGGIRTGYVKSSGQLPSHGHHIPL